MLAPPSSAEIEQSRLVAVLERRAQRAIAARQEAEALLERRSRELDRSNRELRLRHDELQAKLELGNRLLLGAQRTAQLATIHRDRGGSYLASPELSALLGLDRGTEVTPEVLIRHIHPLDRAMIQSSALAFFGGAVVDVDHCYEHRVIRADGKMRWFRWLLRRSVDADGRHLAVSGTVQDFTEQRATERRARALQLIGNRQLRKLRQVEQRLADRVRDLEALSANLQRSRLEAEQAHRARTQFISLMSHNIRTPMNGLLGMMSALADTVLDTSQQHKLTLSRRAGEQLRVLLDDIIDVAGGELDLVSLDPVACAIAETIAGVTDFWLTSVRPAQVTISTTVDPSLPAFALLDQTRFRQLLDNLLSAAVRRSTSRDVALDVRRLDERIVVTLLEDGPRISAQAQALFEADGKELARLASGSMLPSHVGILLCRRIVTRMGGRMGATVAADGRNRLWFDLPLVAIAAPEPAIVMQDQPRRILVAEDIETNQIVACSMLDAIGYEYSVVADGEQAVAAVRRGGFAAVLMDVQMPVMNGTDATRAIRRLPGNLGRIPIIGVTAHVQPAERELLLAAGMNACLAKPIERAGLARALADAIAATPDTEDEDPIETDRFTMVFTPVPVAARETLFDLVAADLHRFAADAIGARQDGDTTALNRATHSMRGVAGNFGARAVLAATGELETCAEEDVGATATRLRAAAAATVARGRALLAESSGHQ